MLATVAVRAGVLAAGAYLAGVRGEDLARSAVGGAVAVQLFVMGYTFFIRPAGE